MAEALPNLFEQTELIGDHTLPEDLFSILETFEDAISKEMPPFYPSDGSTLSPGVGQEAEEAAAIRATKKRKLSEAPAASSDSGSQDGQLQKTAMTTSHITVERNRRKQMNEHLSVLRSLMPCFYAKRGDQASIIGGVVDYIKELQQVLQSLEAKKQRKAYSEVLSPRPVTSSPRTSPLSPRPPPPSPRMPIPISPRTPQPGSPYKPKAQQSVYLSPSLAPSHELSPPFSSAATAFDVAANFRSAVAEVEVKFSGSNVILKTLSHRIPGQALKIIAALAALEGLALEILHISISAIDDYTMLNSFTIKIGIECELSAEELVQEIQQTFL